MRPLDLEEALDFVQREIKQFYSRCNMDDFLLLQCGPDHQHIGVRGGPIGVVMWACIEEKFEECQKLLRPLLKAVEEFDFVEDVEVEVALEKDGEIWYIEFAKAWDYPVT